MADSIRERIIRAVMDSVGPAVAPVSVYRSRVAALQGGQLPAVVVSPVRELMDQGTLCWLSHRLMIAIDVVTGSGLDRAADPLLQAIHVVLSEGGRDLGLEGVTEVMPDEIEFLADQAGELIGVARYRWTVLFRTRHEDLSRSPGA